MRKLRNFLAVALALVVLAACAGPNVATAHPAAVPAGAGAGATGRQNTTDAHEPTPGGARQVEGPAHPAAQDCLFDRLADHAIAQLGLTGAEDDTQRVAAAYRYVIGHTSYLPFDDEALTGSWPALDGCGAAPSIWQVMAFSPLHYGIGSCENYACALMVLLQRMGYEAKYVPGLTWSVQGTLVDHAWVMVEIGGDWYHLDPQLEDNVLGDGPLMYRYFLKDDATFAASHLWGEGLPVADDYGRGLPACAGVPPVMAAEPFEKAPPANLAAAQQRAEALMQGYDGEAPQPEEALPPFPSQIS